MYRDSLSHLFGNSYKKSYKKIFFCKFYWGFSRNSLRLLRIHSDISSGNTSGISPNLSTGITAKTTPESIHWHVSKKSITLFFKNTCIEFSSATKYSFEDSFYNIFFRNLFCNSLKISLFFFCLKFLWYIMIFCIIDFRSCIRYSSKDSSSGLSRIPSESLQRSLRNLLRSFFKNSVPLLVISAGIYAVFF